MTDLDPTLQYSPYFAGLEGKTDAQKNILEDRIDALSEASKDLLFDPDLPDKLKAILDQNRVPPQYTLAMAKILFLAILGDVAVSAIEPLLSKLGLEPNQATTVANGLTGLLQPLIADRGKAIVKEGMRELPPLSRPTETGPRPTAGTATPTRNIIDLRKQP